MVSVVSKLPQGERLREADILAWLDGLTADRPPPEREQLRDACLAALHPHTDPDGIVQDPRVQCALSVTDILAGMNLDSETLAAALLHELHATGGMALDALRRQFGDGVARMVEDMAKIAQVTSMPEGGHRDEAAHQESVRRMLLGIADDIRVILIVLAERLQRMRQLKHASEPIRRAEARDTRDLYAPLANRLGIWQVKWELEDLSLRYLDPEEYQEIAGLLDGKRADRERYIKAVIDLLKAKFAEAGVNHAEVYGRPKHIYSIWKKMKRKNVPFEQIFDLRAVRVMVGSVTDCYAALGVVHGAWRHIPGEFDDYIATPKPNGYRSIHTAVIGPEEKTLEVQIRTRDMHEHAELGVAAHWRYKERGKQDKAFERRVVLMRNWLEQKIESAAGEAEPADDALPSDLDSELRLIYVFTPNGKVIELPKGATPLDFAYAVHSDIGHRCRGAKVEHRIAQLTQPLESGQTVEILTVKEGGPSRDWLSPHLGYLHTNRARSRVRSWFKQQDFGQHVQIGRTSLERELVRLSAGKPDLPKIAQRFNFKTTDDLLAAIGRGEVSPVQVAGLVEHAEPGERKELPLPPPKRKRKKAHTRGGVAIEGVDDLMTHFAGCCKPLPPDPIVGFITRGRGVTIHRADCTALHDLSEEDRGRLTEVQWGDQGKDDAYPVDIKLEAQDRKGLLRDITSIFANEDVAVTGTNTQSDKKTDRAYMRITAEITDLEQLSRVLEKLNQVPSVLDARRVA